MERANYTTDFSLDYPHTKQKFRVGGLEQIDGPASSTFEELQAAPHRTTEWCVAPSERHTHAATRTTPTYLTIPPRRAKVQTKYIRPAELIQMARAATHRWAADQGQARVSDSLHGHVDPL